VSHVPLIWEKKGLSPSALALWYFLDKYQSLGLIEITQLEVNDLKIFFVI
jgi:hypothetical protein